jgi:hypothetical protein
MSASLLVNDCLQREQTYLLPPWALVPVQIATSVICAGTMPAPKNNIVLDDLKEGCASDLFYYIAHSCMKVCYLYKIYESLLSAIK